MRAGVSATAISLESWVNATSCTNARDGKGRRRVRLLSTSQTDTVLVDHAASTAPSGLHSVLASARATLPGSFPLSVSTTRTAFRPAIATSDRRGFSSADDSMEARTRRRSPVCAFHNTRSVLAVSRVSPLAFQLAYLTGR